MASRVPPKSDLTPVSVVSVFSSVELSAGSHKNFLSCLPIVWVLERKSSVGIWLPGEGSTVFTVPRAQEQVWRSDTQRESRELLFSTEGRRVMKLRLGAPAMTIQ